MGKEPVIRHEMDTELVRETCGGSRRIITAQDGSKSSMHIVSIADSKMHYHNEIEEIYYILAGWGYMNINGKDYEVYPGTAIYIPAGAVHGGRGGFVTMVVCTPAFDPDDQFVVAESSVGYEHVDRG